MAVQSYHTYSLVMPADNFTTAGVFLITEKGEINAKENPAQSTRSL